MQDDNYVIELNAVTKSFGQNTVLNNINLKVSPGEFIIIRGKSGVGKSTLLKILGFLETPDTGSIRLFGKDVTKMNDNQLSELRLKNIGFVFQFFNLLPSLTVQENIELPLSLAGVKKDQRKQRVTELLNYFQLERLAERFPDNLSGGEKQRIAIIRALSNNPKMIIADEPTSSIDDENIDLLMSLFSNIAKNQGVTVVMTTTDLYENYSAATSDYLLKDGQLKQNCNEHVISTYE
jgi:putative ABC transport system ATP-binding protein